MVEESFVVLFFGGVGGSSGFGTLVFVDFDDEGVERGFGEEDFLVIGDLAEVAVREVLVNLEFWINDHAKEMIFVLGNLRDPRCNEM